MGGIWTQAASLVGSISELVGYKSGIALTKTELTEMTTESFHSEYFEGDLDRTIRIRSEEVEECVAFLLYKLGRLDSPSIFYEPEIPLREIMENPDLSLVFKKVGEMFLRFLKEQIDSGRKTIDPRPMLEAAKREYGKVGYVLAMDRFQEINHRLYISPWQNIKECYWKNVIELKDLFESENLEPLYGDFVDQRYIDYLHRNFDKIREINWRKFEGLTAEYFSRLGYRVELGPGRNDGGVDIRVWKEKGDEGFPPNILVQCKRYNKTKIDRVVVKALWADVMHEKADSGLIVTTSKLSDGAKNDCSARAYPISEVCSDTLFDWVKEMRLPNKGVFLSE